VPELGRDDGVILHVDEGASQVGGEAERAALRPSGGRDPGWL
jgi:hypothetical protein